MAWYPGAVRKPVTRFTTKMKPNRVNLHTAVSSTTSLFSYFNQPGKVCSHFYVREDGTVEQYVDTSIRAAADLQGNADTISIETWDGYRRLWTSSADLPEWTTRQLVALAQLLRWISEVHNIPLTPLGNSLPGSRGVSYHRLGVNPWRVSGGLLYSTAYGKVCPGDRRIAQIPMLLTMAGAQGGGGMSVPVVVAPPPVSRGYSMTYVREVQALLNKVRGENLLVDGILGPITVGAVKRYQAARGLVVDGDPGPITISRLRSDAAAQAPAPAPAPAPAAPHSDVFPLRVDGIWGPVTWMAVQIRLSIPANGLGDRLAITALQSRIGTYVDGDFGPVTWAALARHLGVSPNLRRVEIVKALQRRLNSGAL